ncbi:unnamed protein product [Pleuronectes platessa]|uniref:Uncharacterized protein n=1 Tax=Pleuronectes platessa TaxID=8262 RepID=A0A9N7ZD93_PLEPL|nr:unnamed protein product [Pleuronectes platessa]
MTRHGSLLRQTHPSVDPRVQVRPVGDSFFDFTVRVKPEASESAEALLSLSLCETVLLFSCCCSWPAAGHTLTELHLGL